MADLVLVLNCGSSSVKFAVLQPQHETVVTQGIVERIGSKRTSLVYDGASTELGYCDYQQALRKIMDLLSTDVDLVKQLVAVGHRVVHGGERFQQSVIINDEVLAQIKKCIVLAPLHNPANVLGVEFSQQYFPQLPQVAVFDTAFHQSMPDYAFIYPLPYSLYTEQQIRRYGFHGTSHRYVTAKAAEVLQKPITELALLSAHLGNGCSVAAVLNGKSLDTSMGLTPLEGVMMGTRCGDIDPSIISVLQRNLNLDIDAVDGLLNKKSGLLGVSQLTADMRELTQASEQGNEQAQLAIEIFCYRLAKYLAGLVVPLGRIDALIFTGGIGENSILVRAKVLQWLTYLGFELNNEANMQHGKATNANISKDGSIATLIIKTNEELLIAKDAMHLLEEK